MDVLVRCATLKPAICARVLRRGAFALALGCVLASSTRADEIRLKNGKKLYGVIVAFEDNMFKVKTEYGFELVEKDKIASIVPSTTPGENGAKGEGQPAAKKGSSRPENVPPAAEPAVASGDSAVPDATNASAKSGPVEAAKHDKPLAQSNSAAAKPESPAKTAATATVTSRDSAPPSATLNAPLASAAPPKEEPPVNREAIQGTSYTNYTHGFRMYKAPSWSVNEDARTALPNAIVAMGTFNESTLLVVGLEKTKEPLETAAKTVEKRLHEVYDNYRIISQRKTTVGGQPAMEFHYRGLADGHDWSGTLAVISRGNDVLTVLGMTYADSDLIQIQENVIARSIASLDFSVH